MDEKKIIKEYRDGGFETCYYKNGVLHRGNDEASRIYSSSKEMVSGFDWFQNGVRHRINNPSEDCYHFHWIFGFYIDSCNQNSNFINNNPLLLI